MPIRFQADADLNQIIVSAVVRRVPAIAFRTATTAGLVPQHLLVGEVANDLILIWTATEAEEWTDRIAFLPI